MDSAYEYWELVPFISGLLVCACLAIGIAAYLVRRLTAPKRIPVPEHWMHCDQQLFFNPGALPRGMAVLMLSIVLVGGVVVGPFVLGVAPGIAWYLREDWIIALFVSITLSVVGYFVLKPKRPRCPSCIHRSGEILIALTRTHRAYLSLPSLPGRLADDLQRLS